MSEARATGSVEVRAWDYPAGHVVARHRHATGQLVYAARGVARVATAGERYVVPPQLAVWIPAGIEHSVEARRTMAMRTAYVAQSACAGLPGDVRVVAVAPLLRELLLALVDRPRPYRGADARLAAVLLDRLAALPATPLALPWPRDGRLRRVAEALERDPAMRATLADFAREAGATRRTLARLFPKDTGLTFGAWRRQLRLLRAVELLAAGQSVTATALDVGYDSPSAFVARFRAALGATPRAYLACLRRGAPPPDPHAALAPASGNGAP